MPVSSGKCFNNAVNASSPPAEAPTPTIGHDAPSAALRSRAIDGFLRREVLFLS
jgi:hypothetical protein